MTPIDTNEFGQYRCHKLVRAAQLVSVTPIGIDHPDHNVLGAGPVPLRVHWQTGQAGGIFDAPANMLARYTPVAGDYLVAYEDGYLSFSPKAAFESGYHAVLPPRPVTTIAELEAILNGQDDRKVTILPDGSIVDLEGAPV